MRKKRSEKRAKASRSPADSRIHQQLAGLGEDGFSTGAFIGEAAPPDPRRARAPVDEQAAQAEMANFDPTKLKYPKELIGR